MYELKRNERGIFAVYWTEGRRSKRQSLRTKDKAEAEERFAGWLMGERDYRTDSSSPTINDIFERYEAQRVPRMMDDQTALYALRVVRQHMGGETPITMVDQALIDSFVSSLRAEGKSDSSIKAFLAFFTAAVNHSIKQRLLDPSLKPVYEQPDLHCPSRDTLITPDEVQALLAIAREKRVKGKGPSRLELYLMMIWQTGARDHCVRMARWSQIDLDAGVVDFRVPGRRETRKRRPVVPVSDALLAFLKSAKPFAGNDMYLGTTGSIADTLKRAARDVGCPHVSAHVFRHTWATEAIESGVSLEHVAGVLGDTYKTVWDNYSHLRPEPLRPAANFREKREEQNRSANGAQTP